MSIIIKKKPQFNKKRLFQRIGALTFIYFFSFFLLYVFFGERTSEIEMATSQLETTIYDNEGDKMIAEERYPAAIHYFQKVLDNNEEDFFAYNRLGYIYFKLQQYDKAKFYLYKARELAPKYTDTYIKIVNIYLEQNDFLSAENIIELMPTNNANDFIAKANAFVKLAKKEDSLEEKIVHYTRAVSYLKKCDENLYNSRVNELIAVYFQLVEYYKQQNEPESALALCKNIIKYKDDCLTNNDLALHYMNLDDNLILKHIKRATVLAKTQEEKRLTKKNLIDLKYYFEKKGDYQSLTLLSAYLLMLDESTILVDEKFAPFAIVDDSFDYIFSKDEVYPEITFAVLNQQEEPVNFLKARISIYLTSKRIHDTVDAQVVTRDVPLKSKEKSNQINVRLEKNLKLNKLKQYTLALSLSKDGKNWQLYRLYTKNNE